MEQRDFNFMELCHKVLSGWKTILLWCGVAAAIGLVYAFSVPKTYTVTCKLAPEMLNKNNTLSSLSSLASLAGVSSNLNLSANSDAMYPELYPDVISSTPFLVDLFTMPVNIMEKKDSLHTIWYDYQLNHTRKSWIGVVLNAPFRLLGLISDLIKGEKDEKTIPSSFDPCHLTRKQDSMVRLLRKSIETDVDKKTSEITIAVKSQSPAVAAEMSRVIIENLQTYVADYRTEKARADLKYYSDLYEEARLNYYEQQQRLARYLDANQGVILQRVLTEKTRLQNEADLAYQLYNQTAQRVQLAQEKVQECKPVVVVIQPPTIPYRGKPSKSKVLLTCVFLGAVLSCCWIAFLKDSVNKIRNER